MGSREKIVKAGRASVDGPGLRDNYNVIPFVPEMHRLERRIGRVHLRQRLGLESDYSAEVLGRGRTFFHIENWYSLHAVIRVALKCLGLHRRGQRNAQTIRAVHNEVELANLSPAFDGFTLLHISDPHLDMNESCTPALIESISRVEYDLCVITGDFRARTFGPIEPALRELSVLCSHIQRPTYAVLGNHDSIAMVPAMEDMGIKLLLNESMTVHRSGATLYLAGIDDPHYFRLENFEKAVNGIPPDAPSIILSHSPESYRRAAHVGFGLMLSGHTHGGQICLPGGFALMTNADCPRRFCAGAWAYHGMRGYTSVGSGTCVVDVRFNCQPEITLHHLRSPCRMTTR